VRCCCRCCRCCRCQNRLFGALLGGTLRQAKSRYAKDADSGIVKKQSELEVKVKAKVAEESVAVKERLRQTFDAEKSRHRSALQEVDKLIAEKAKELMARPPPVPSAGRSPSPIG
jgi:hypothetical protein